MPDESTRKTFIVALLLALGCALLVSVTAFELAERQQANRDRDLMKNVLIAAGLYEARVAAEALLRPLALSFFVERFVPQQQRDAARQVGVPGEALVAVRCMTT